MPYQEDMLIPWRVFPVELFFTLKVPHLCWEDVFSLLTEARFLHSCSSAWMKIWALEFCVTKCFQLRKGNPNLSPLCFDVFLFEGGI